MRLLGRFLETDLAASFWIMGVLLIVGLALAAAIPAAAVMAFWEFATNLV